MLNKQFSPTNSDEGAPGVVMGLGKKKRNKGFELKRNDFELDDQDKQALAINDNYSSEDFEQVSDF